MVELWYILEGYSGRLTVAFSWLLGFSPIGTVRISYSSTESVLFYVEFVLLVELFVAFLFFLLEVEEFFYVEGTI